LNKFLFASSSIKKAILADVTSMLFTYAKIEHVKTQAYLLKKQITYDTHP